MATVTTGEPYRSETRWLRRHPKGWEVAKPSVRGQRAEARFEPTRCKRAACFFCEPDDAHETGIVFEVTNRGKNRMVREYRNDDGGYSGEVLHFQSMGDAWNAAWAMGAHLVGAPLETQPRPWYETTPTSPEQTPEPPDNRIDGEGLDVPAASEWPAEWPPIDTQDPTPKPVPVPAGGETGSRAFAAP